MTPNTTRTTWRHSAIALAASTLFLAVASVGTAHAQSNATGNIFGSVQAAPGTTILIENVGTGFKRTLTPDANGRFVFTALQPGTYKATLQKDGKPAGTAEDLTVLAGQGTEVVFAGGSGNQVVEVKGRIARLDVSSSDNGSTFTAKQLDALPIQRTLDSIIQLAPNTTRADPRYSGGASMGGGAPSENSYYINGFPVTNPLNQLGSSELPFGAISQAQVLTGGFGAEFGRSIGGVVNITTKSGTNKWEGGVSMSVTPSGMRSPYKDRNYGNTGAAGNEETDGTLYWRRSDRKRDEWTYGGYIGGPIIQDQLFMFVAAEKLRSDDAFMSKPTSNFTSGTFSSGGWEQDQNTNDRYLAKFDWQITKSNLLELTLIGDRYAQQQSLSGYDYTTGVRSGPTTLKANYVNADGQTEGVGAASQILRWTSYLTDDLTVTALLGQSKSPHSNSYDGYDVFGNIRQVDAGPTVRYPGLTYGSPYPFAPSTTVLAPGAKDKVNAGRFDLEYKLGEHLLRTGVDAVQLKSNSAGDVTAGGGTYVYRRTTSPSLKPNGASVAVGAAPGVLTQPAGVDADGNPLTAYYYGYEQIFTTATNAQSNQSAFYLEDRWQLTKNLRITPGLRVEKYENKNGDGETFLKVDTQIHPRFSFAWDAMGDGSTKIFGSAGRYGVQIPTHLAVRGASRSTYTRQPFIYTDVDPTTGEPIGRVNIGDPYSTNNEYGQPKDANTVAAQNLKPNSQDELTLGIERAINEKLNVGAMVTYRKLVATIDDLCDPRPFEKYAADNGIDTSNWGGFGCASFNPGKANTFLIDYAGTGQYTKVNLSKEALGFEKAKRTYMALDFFAEHPLSDGWYGKVTYTYAKSKGNTEGQTLSDVAQTDVAATQTWDHPELMQGAYGYLPGDRRHQIKAFGFLRVMPEVDVGGNLLLASGRPKNCIGNFVGFDADGNPIPGSGTPSFGTSAEDFDGSYSYGSAYRRCSFDGGQTLTSTPRGTAGNLPWDVRLDMNVVYRPASVKGLSLRMDVFNVFNKQTTEAISEVHEADYDPSTVLPTYGRVIGYTAPRAFKFTASYDF